MPYRWEVEPQGRGIVPASAIGAIPMTVPCLVSAAEMREAFRLNLTPSFWWKAALGNIRTLIYLVVLVSFIGASVAKGRAINWEQTALLIGLIALFFGLYLF